MRAIALANLGRAEAGVASLAPDGLDEPSDRALLSGYALKPALKESRFSDGVALARALIQADGRNAEYHLLLAKAYHGLGRAAEAQEAVERAGEINPADLDVAARRIQGRLQANAVKQAAELAKAYVAQARGEPRLTRLCLTALMRADQPAAAGPIIEDFLQSGTAAVEDALLAARILSKLGRAKDAVRLLEALIARGEESARAHLVLAQAMVASGAPLESAFEHVKEAHRIAPDDPSTLQVLGQVRLGLGHVGDATALLKTLFEKMPRGRNIMLYARALRLAKQYGAAADVLLSGGDQLREDKNWKRQTTVALIQAGRVDQAATMYGELVAERRAGLAATFVEHLNAVRQHPRQEPIPAARLDWAWDRIERITQKPPSADRTEWQRRARHGFEMDRAILDWVECRPTDIHEVVDLLQYPWESTAPIRELMRKGKGVFVAGAHIGAMYAGPVVLQAAQVPFRVVAQMPGVSSASYLDHLISTSDQGPSSVVRQVLRALSSGEAVTLTVDATMNPSAIRVPWEDAMVTYTDFVASACYRRGVPSVWGQPFWREDRINFIVREMPMPEPGEAEGDFLNRWRDAYLAELRSFLLRGPENLRLAEGIWRTIPT